MEEQNIRDSDLSFEHREVLDVLEELGEAKPTEIISETSSGSPDEIQRAVRQLWSRKYISMTKDWKYSITQSKE